MSDATASAWPSKESRVVAVSLGLLVQLVCGGFAAASELVRAAENNRLDRVEALLEGGADPNEPSKGGLTALHQAAANGHTDVVALLLRRGANVDQAEYDGDTALMNAAYSGHLEIVKMLLEHGADQELKSSFGLTAIQHAREEGHSKVVRALRDGRRRVAQEVLPDVVFKTSALQSKNYQPGYRKRLAVVIGIDKYQKWPPLAGATGDARRVAEQLRRMGFDDVMELFDEKATRSGILDLLGSELTAKAGEEDLVVIYFAGHGQTEVLPSEKRGYIIPVDGDTTRIYSTAIPMRQLRELRDKLSAKHVYYVMDSCYSGLGFTRGLSTVPRSASNYIDKITSKRSVQMVTAGGEGEEAIEREGQGLFTTHFLAALAGKADANADGWVTANEIGTFVRPLVTDDSNGKQTPQVGRLSGEGEIAFKITPR